GGAPGPVAWRQRDRHLRPPALLRGAGAPAARPQQGLRRGDPQAAGDGAPGNPRRGGIRVRDRERRVGYVRGSAAVDRPGRARAAPGDGADRRPDCGFVYRKGISVSKFEFVTLAAARAKQLQAGCTPKVEGSDKTARLAMKEVREKKIERVPDEE